jgi:hypothetical protein
MPLIGPNTYLPTGREFLNHWTQTQLNSSVTLTLQNGYGLAEFTDDITTLDTQFTRLNDEQNAFRTELATRDREKSELVPLLKRYRAIINASLPNTAWSGTLPKVPNYAATPAKFLEPFRAMKTHWSQLNALPAETIPGLVTPLVLPVINMTLAQFSAKLAQLEAVYLQVGAAESAVDSVRAGRDGLLPNLKERMKQYGNALKATLGTTHPSVKNAPRLSTPSSTPLPPLNATIQWDGAQNKAVVNFNRLPDVAKIVRYELRLYPGPRYITRNEQTIAQVASTAHHFATDIGLQFPGAIASYRVYALTESGRETGSPPLVMMVPDEG